MKVGISYVSEEQARINLNYELPHWDFDRVKEDAFAEWNRELGKSEWRAAVKKRKLNSIPIFGILFWDVIRFRIVTGNISITQAKSL